MAIQNKKSIYEEFSFEDMNKFRKDAYKTMELYNLTPRSINMDLVEANEEIAIQIFLYGADLARFLHDEEMSVADDDIDFMQRAFDSLQDEMPAKEMSFVAKHYEDALSVYHCGFLFMNGFYVDDQSEEEDSSQDAEAMRNELVKRDAIRTELIKAEEDVFHKLIESSMRSQDIRDYLDAHLEETYYLMRKGKSWWKMGEHGDIDENFTKDEEIRKEYFREIMMDESMLNNVIVEEEKELGYYLFRLGAVFEHMMETRESESANSK